MIRLLRGVSVVALVVAVVLFTFANVSEWMNEDETLSLIHI